MRNGTDVEVADQDVGDPLVAGAPGALREAVCNVKRRAADDEQHAERDQEGRDLEPRHEQAVDQPDQRRADDGDEEADLERDDALIEQDPHHDRRESEHRADGKIELAGGHQQRHCQRDEAEFDREDEGVGNVERRQEFGLERGKNDDLDDEQHERPELGLGDQAPEQRRLVGGTAFRAA